MKVCLRNMLLVVLLSLGLTHAPAHESHENSAGHFPAKTENSRISMDSSSQHALFDYLWLLGSFLVSAGGVVVLVRYLHR